MIRRSPHDITGNIYYNIYWHWKSLFTPIADDLSDNQRNAAWLKKAQQIVSAPFYAVAYPFAAIDYWLSRQSYWLIPIQITFGLVSLVIAGTFYSIGKAAAWPLKTWRTSIAPTPEEPQLIHQIKVLRYAGPYKDRTGPTGEPLATENAETLQTHPLRGYPKILQRMQSNLVIHQTSLGRGRAHVFYLNHPLESAYHSGHVDLFFQDIENTDQKNVKLIIIDLSGTVSFERFDSLIGSDELGSNVVGYSDLRQRTEAHGGHLSFFYDSSGGFDITGENVIITPDLKFALTDPDSNDYHACQR